jgi:hypothetical protein
MYRGFPEEPKTHEWYDIVVWMLRGIFLGICFFKRDKDTCRLDFSKKVKRSESSKNEGDKGP